MGGRGGSGGGGAIAAGKPQTSTTTYYSGRSMGGSRFKNEVLEATADKKGNVTFSYATPTFS